MSIYILVSIPGTTDWYILDILPDSFKNSSLTQTCYRYRNALGLNACWLDSHSDTKVTTRIVPRPPV